MSESGSPSEQLATKVVDRLIAAGLVREEKRAALSAKISDGSMKGEDWKLEIELALAKGAAK